MARLTYSQKTRRVLKFLEASVDPRINGPLAGAGYSDEDVEEGWTLLRQAGTARKVQKTPVPLSPRTREQIDQFENYWFPLVSASLRRRYPAVHDAVFLNLSQEGGVEVAMNVSIFLERIREVENGPQGQEVRALLDQRGFTEAVIAEGEQLIREFRTVRPAENIDLSESK